MSHTKEPWSVNDNPASNYRVEIFNVGQKGKPRVIARLPQMTDKSTPESNAARIVACVNACAGMADPAAEIARLRESDKVLLDSESAVGALTNDLRNLTDKRDSLRSERDALREAVDAFMSLDKSFHGTSEDCLASLVRSENPMAKAVQLARAAIARSKS